MASPMFILHGMETMSWIHNIHFANVCFCIHVSATSTQQSSDCTQNYKKEIVYIKVRDEISAIQQSQVFHVNNFRVIIL